MRNLYSKLHNSCRKIDQLFSIKEKYDQKYSEKHCCLENNEEPSFFNIYCRIPSFNLANTKWCKKFLKMIENLTYGYSSESTQQELSNEYQHDRVQMTFKDLCNLVLWTEVASALEGLRSISACPRNLGHHSAVHSRVRKHGVCGHTFLLVSAGRIHIQMSTKKVPCH